MRERYRSKAFIISSLILALLTVGAVVLSAVLRDDSRRQVDIMVVATSSTDARATQLAAAFLQIAPVLDVDVETTPNPSRAQGEQAVRGGGADVLIDGTELVFHRGISTTAQVIAQAGIDAVDRSARARSAGLSDDDLLEILASTPTTVIELDPEDPDQGIRTASAGIGLVLVFLAIQVHGSAVLMGAIEEKSSRVVEVLLGHVQPRTLLLGKVLGIGAVGLSQVVLVAGSAFGALLAVRSIDVPKVPADAIAWFVVWFVLGFLLYATVFAGLGSLVSRQEDAQSVVAPATMPLLGAYFASFAVIASPDATLARIASVFPLSAPLVMPVRIAAGTPTWWEIALSIALVVGLIYLVLNAAARLYSRNLLRSGSNANWRTVWQSIRSGNENRTRPPDPSG